MKTIILGLLLLNVFACSSSDAVRRSLTNINEELIIMQKSITDNQISLEELNAVNAATQADISANTDAIAEVRAEIAYLNNELLLMKNSPIAITPPINESQNIQPATNDYMSSIADIESIPIIIENDDIGIVLIDNVDDDSQVIIIDNSNVASNNQNKKSDYLYAIELLKSRRYKESRAKFQEFINNYPTDTLATNSQYWIAETYYSVNDYKNALTAFNIVLTKYPKSTKVPDAKLKIAYIKAVLGDRQASVVLLNSIIKDYPKSAPAKLARTKLNSWGK